MLKAMHIKKLYALLFLCLFSGKAYSQFDDINWSQIYKDQDITVEVAFDTANLSCVVGNKPNTYFYRISGAKKSSQFFVNWTMSYMQCSGILYEQDIAFDIGPNCHAKNNIEFHNDLDFTFTGTIFKAPYGMSSGSLAKVGGRVLAMQYSSAPDHIKGNNVVVMGNQGMLEVMGGALGIGANWYWYKDSCSGAYIGTGKYILVKPDSATRYFVRAEGKNNITACTSILIKVSNESRAATAIDGLAMGKLCKGTSVTLRSVGGALGPGAKWVWYADKCGSASIVGKGAEITISPTKSATYYVRAEGPYNTTQCVSKEIQILDNSVAAQSISGATSPCEQTTNMYKVVGGELASDAEWKWYGGECSKNYLGKGPSISLNITQSGNLLVRAEGYCNTTSCTSLSITTNKNSTAPGDITASSTTPMRNRSFNLSVSGGSLGSSAKWVWYKSSVSPSNRLDYGTTIKARTKKYERYYVVAEGQCNQSKPVFIDIYPIKVHSWHSTYYTRDYTNTFLHVGYSILGFETINDYLPVKCIVSAPTLPQVTIDSFVGVQSYGYKAELSFHPIIKKYFSLGVNGLFAAGGSFFGGYTRFQYGTEMTLGFSPFKALLTVKRENRNISYNNSSTDNNIQYTFDQSQKITRDFIGAGFRIGRYGKKSSYKNAKCLDLTFNFSRFDPGINPPLSYYHFKSYMDWQHGFTLLYWVHNDVKLQFDYSLNDSKYEKYRSNGHANSGSYLMLSISLYNRDRFY